MKRVLCVRFPNWPIQALRNQLRETATNSSALALHTAPIQPTTDQKPKQKPKSNSSSDDDLKFVRAIFPASMTGPAIVAVSPDAWSRGVRPGMPLAEARSMSQPVSVPSHKRNRTNPQVISTAVEFHEWHPHRDRELLKATAELTRRYAPVVGLDAVPMPDSLLLDITGCGPLFGGEAGLAESLLKDLLKAGWSCRIAIAQSVSAAWALTHADIPKRHASTAADKRGAHRNFADAARHDLPIQLVPAGQHLAEINPLPATAARLDLSDLEILKHLGIRTIGQFLSLPREDLPSRLSSNAVLKVQQLLGVVDEPIDPLPEANPVAAAWSSDEPACGIRDIQHILSHMTEQISAQLIRRRIACSSVRCLFKCVDGSTVPLTAGVVKPTQSSELLHEVLFLKIETETTLSIMEAAGQKTPAASEPNTADWSGRIASLASQPFGFVSMIATVSPIPVARQRDLFSPTEHIVGQEEVATLITRLSSRLGGNAVLTVRTQADPRPAFSVVTEPVLTNESTTGHQSQLNAIPEVLTAPVSSTGPETNNIQPRPLRLLVVPQPIPGSASDRKFPSELLLFGKLFELTDYSVPERIQTAWWTDDPCHRDYYQVTSRSGSRFWLFRDLQSGQWFLHGIFD